MFKSDLKNFDEVTVDHANGGVPKDEEMDERFRQIKNYVGEQADRIKEILTQDSWKVKVDKDIQSLKDDMQRICTAVELNNSG